MKELFKKVFAKDTAAFIVGIVSILLIFTFVVFPGLTAPDTLINIFSAILALFTLVFLYHYVSSLIIPKPIEEIEPGETELDYIPKKEVVKKKPKKTKREYPLEPHAKTVRASRANKPKK